RAEVETHVEGGYPIATGPSITRLLTTCHDLQEELDQWSRHDPTQRRRTEERLTQSKAELRAEVRAIARLSRPDGALLLDDYLRAIRFATKLRAPRWTGEVTLGRGVPPGYPAFNRTMHGTRHNSAIDFAGSIPSCVAFAVSSDGPVRAFARLNDAVAVW